MLRKPVLILFFFSILSALSAEEYLHTEKIINKAAKAATKIWDEYEIEIEPLDADQSSKYYSSYDTLFRIVGGDSTLGFLVLSSAKGRFELFDFMMVYTSETEVIDMRVMVYRSEYGSQVCSKAWLKQFYGIPSSKSLQYGSDVDALSGATFSARSLTEQVNRLNRLMRENSNKN
jgi:Na+-translocating ferredoxin:NAD+ oxidoreductase RnfG subunit